MASPFHRAQVRMAAIAAAMAMSNVGARHAAMAEIGPYRSRGKGMGKGAKQTVRPSRSKYKPHTGAKEIERAKRCYMVHTFPARRANDGSDNWVAVGRAAPTLCQRAAGRAA